MLLRMSELSSSPEDDFDAVAADEEEDSGVGAAGTLVNRLLACEVG